MFEYLLELWIKSKPLFFGDMEGNLISKEEAEQRQALETLRIEKVHEEQKLLLEEELKKST